MQKILISMASNSSSFIGKITEKMNNYKNWLNPYHNVRFFECYSLELFLICPIGIFVLKVKSYNLSLGMFITVETQIAVVTMNETA